MSVAVGIEADRESTAITSDETAVWVGDCSIVAIPIMLKMGPHIRVLPSCRSAVAYHDKLAVL